MTWEDTLTGIQRDLNRYRTGHPGVPGTVGHRPESITLSPADWREITDALMAGRFGFRHDGPPVAMLWGIPVIEDPTLAPGSWRLEH